MTNNEDGWNLYRIAIEHHDQIDYIINNYNFKHQKDYFLFYKDISAEEEKKSVVVLLIKHAIYKNVPKEHKMWLELVNEWPQNH